ncbi:FecR domain-containing protein [Luteolibacter sp. Populi]|uniref:FecR domain-containing protein n=1 Tax=Luteolibacter sp. Populi TaxID=3230487 RepID=UPI003467AA18
MMKWQADGELRRLVDGMLDGSLSRTDVARLEERMEADPRAMEYYLSLAGQESLLAELCAGERDLPLPMPVKKRPRFHWAAAAALIAAAIATAVVMKRNPRSEAPSVAKTGPEARLSSEVGAAWNGQHLSPGAALGTGSVLAISSGLAELTHRSGTRLLIEGPASYEVTGPNAGRLKHGKLVAEVPPGAEGYVVEYAEGRVVDLGTEFAISAPADGGHTEVGVFRGEVRVQQENETFEQGAALYAGHAVRTGAGSATRLRSIPFDQDSFIRQIPSHEYPWFYHGGEAPMEWDVSQLVWSAGNYLAVMKWMNGPQALVLQKVELLLDGQVVGSDEHPCSVGHLTSTLGNVYQLKVGPGAWKRGRWTLRAWPFEAAEGGHSEGILMFEDGALLNSEPGDFSGPWDYVHDGNRYRRLFNPDGTCSLWINDTPSDYFKDAAWELRGGILQVNFPASDVAEEHLLRDGNSLLFINQPYRNARRGK